MAVFEMEPNTNPESLAVRVSYYFIDSIKYTVENLLKRSTWQNALTAVLLSLFIQKRPNEGMHHVWRMGTQQRLISVSQWITFACTRVFCTAFYLNRLYSTAKNSSHFPLNNNQCIGSHSAVDVMWHIIWEGKINYATNKSSRN
jgi:hypothetical protein